MDPESATAASTDFPLLSAIEARILGSLVEKEATTPENYPLTAPGAGQPGSPACARPP